RRRIEEPEMQAQRVACEREHVPELSAAENADRHAGFLFARRGGAAGGKTTAGRIGDRGWRELGRFALRGIFAVPRESPGAWRPGSPQPAAPNSWRRTFQSRACRRGC